MSPWRCALFDIVELVVQVEHLTRFVMADAEGAAASDADEAAKEQRRGNRRDTWAPGVIGAAAAAVCACDFTHRNLYKEMSEWCFQHSSALV